MQVYKFLAKIGVRGHTMGVCSVPKGEQQELLLVLTKLKHGLAQFQSVDNQGVSDLVKFVSSNVNGTS